MERDSKILVLGARGLVGSALVRELRAQGYNNLLTPTSAELNLDDPVVTRWYFSVFRPEYVFFCAARVGGIADNVARKVAFLQDNLKIELNVLSNAAAYNVIKLLFVGTSCCYPRNCNQPMKPEYLWTGALEPTTEAYSVAKLAGIKLCQYYHETGKNFIVVLPCNIFGERDNFDPETAHCLPGMLARMHAAKIAGDSIFEIWGNGKQQRELIFSEDLARGLVLAMEKYNEVMPLNLGSGLELTMRELAEILVEVTGYYGSFKFNLDRPTGVPRKVLDNTVADGLGWRAATPFREAIQKTYDWFKLNCYEQRHIEKSDYSAMG